MVLPLSASAKQSRCGSAARSTPTRARPSSSTPIGTPTSSWSGPSARTSSRWTSSGSSDDRRERAAGPRGADRGHEPAGVAVAHRRGTGRQPRCGDHHRRAVRVQPVARPCGHRGGAPPVDLGLGRLAQPQLDAAAEKVLERGPQLAPPVRRHHEVQAVGEPLRRERQQRGLQVVELAAQHEVAVDHEQDVRRRLVRELACGAAGPELLDRGDARGPEQPFAPDQRRRAARRRHGARRPGAGGP